MNKITMVFFVLGLTGLFLLGCQQTDLLGDEHKHSDLKIFIHGEELNLSEEKYQSTKDDPKSNFMHVHDGDGDVLHMHASDITLQYFFNSIGIQLNEECITLDNGTEYCSNENNRLQLFVDGKKSDAIGTYVFEDLERLLLTYGAESDEEIAVQMALVTDKACIQSETCPGRGNATDKYSCLTSGNCLAE